MEYTFFIGIIVVSILLVWIIDKFSKRKMNKYIVSIIPLISSLYYFYDARFIKEGMVDLAEIIGLMIFGLIFITMIITSLIMDYIKKRKK